MHFSNKVFGRSIDVDVVDGAAIIPDILLQTDKDLNVWAFVGTPENGYTKISKTFKVNQRNKPADYVFTPTDQITLQTIQSQIGDLSDLTTEAKENLVAAINEAAASGGSGSMDLRVADGYVQYSTDGGSTWKNLIAMENLKGDPGAPGKDGHSPAVTATKSGKTTTISVDGASIATVEDGADGAPGSRGSDGITPTIGQNGNWFLGEEDTGKPSRGADGATGATGATGQKGADGKSAYAYAVEGGYTGTEEDFAAKLASGALIVHVTGVNDNLSADKTYVDIRDAILDGTPVLVDYGGVRFPLISMGNSLFFGANQCVETSVATVIIEITSNDEVYDFSAQIDIPTTLPNPNALTFTGAVTGSYDGSAPLEVNIPQGGGGALSGLSIADNYDIELISQVIIDQGNIPTAGITVTQKDDGSPFAYDGLLIWSDAKSSGSYTTFNFNGYTNYPIAMAHGDRNFLNLYVTDGVTMSIVSGKDVRYVIKQSHADTGNLFYPDAIFQRVPEKFTSFKIGADGIASVKFYKAWGLTRK